MKPYNDFTLMFQGPLHKNFIYGLLNNYREYTDNIVISHWDTDNLELLEYLKEYNIPHKLVTNTFHKKYNVYHNQNVYYQAYTTLRGMREVTTPFVLKMRTDQWYGNLVPMFEAVRNNPNKYVCVNLHFRPEVLVKYHASDKLIGGNTSDMLRTFEIAEHRIVNNPVALMAGAYMYTDDRNIISEQDMLNDLAIYSYADPSRKLATQYPETPLLGTIQIFPSGYIGIAPEMVMGTSYLFAKGIYPSPKDSVRIVKENFHIVKVEDMLPYINKDGTSDIEHNSMEIHSIEDYA
jgi:WavE lipopolysaccharide synthesis